MAFSHSTSKLICILEVKIVVKKTTLLLTKMKITIFGILFLTLYVWKTKGKQGLT